MNSCQNSLTLPWSQCEFKIQHVTMARMIKNSWQDMSSLFRRACVSVQCRQNLRCSLIQAGSQEETSVRKLDPWLLWMAGHAQLKFVKTECSKTQSLLTRHIYSSRGHSRFYRKTGFLMTWLISDACARHISVIFWKPELHPIISQYN